MRTFKGRVVLGGNLIGESVVSHQGFNALGSYWTGLSSRSPKSMDHHNPDLYEKIIGGKILCLTKGIGSTGGGMMMQCAAEAGIAPVAMLYSEHIDPITAAGIILTNVWNGIKIIAVDKLGAEFLDFVKDGQKIEIKEDGTVIVND